MRLVRTAIRHLAGCLDRRQEGREDGGRERGARELLGRERERIERGLAELRPAAPGELARVDQHLAVASELFEGELDSSLAEQLRRELELVERAAARLAAGAYGLSIGSGKPIPDERLEVLRTAERTAEEQERYERERGYV